MFGRRCSAPLVLLLDCKLHSDVYRFCFRLSPTVFHTAACPAGICLNSASCTAASLLDQDVFVFSLLSLWSSSIEEEKAQMWYWSCFHKQQRSEFWSDTEVPVGQAAKKRQLSKPIKECKRNGGEKKHFLDLKIFGCSSLYFLCLNIL